MGTGRRHDKDAIGSEREASRVFYVARSRQLCRSDHGASMPVCCNRPGYLGVTYKRPIASERAQGLADPLIAYQRSRRNAGFRALHGVWARGPGALPWGTPSTARDGLYPPTFIQPNSQLVSRALNNAGLIAMLWRCDGWQRSWTVLFSAEPQMFLASCRTTE